LALPHSNPTPPIAIPHTPGDNTDPIAIYPYFLFSA
jgi:hypothetical protein